MPGHSGSSRLRPLWSSLADRLRGCPMFACPQKADICVKKRSSSGIASGHVVHLRRGLPRWYLKMFPITCTDRGRRSGALSISDFSLSRSITLLLGRSFLITIDLRTEVAVYSIAEAGAEGDITQGPEQTYIPSAFARN